MVTEVPVWHVTTSHFENKMFQINFIKLECLFIIPLYLVYHATNAPFDAEWARQRNRRRLGPGIRF